MFSVKVGRRPIGECQPIEYCEVENKLPVSLVDLPTLHAALSGAAELLEDILDASVSPAEESFRKILRLLLDPKNVLPPPPLEDESELGDCDLDLLKLHTIVKSLSVAAADCLVVSSCCRRMRLKFMLGILTGSEHGAVAHLPLASTDIAAKICRAVIDTVGITHTLIVNNHTCSNC